MKDMIIIILLSHTFKAQPDNNQQKKDNNKITLMEIIKSAEINAIVTRNDATLRGCF